MLLNLYFKRLFLNVVEQLEVILFGRGFIIGQCQKGNKNERIVIFSFIDSFEVLFE
jgi:hypothetical protein